MNTLIAFIVGMLLGFIVGGASIGSFLLDKGVVSDETDTGGTGDDPDI